MDHLLTCIGGPTAEGGELSEELHAGALLPTRARVLHRQTQLRTLQGSTYATLVVKH